MQMISTEASPAPDLTFAYMLTGILGMFLAAAVLVWQPDSLLTRWHPATLAAVHLFALAGLMPIMLGALFQFVPVACGLSLPRWGVLDGVILLALFGGACCLAGGFLSGNSVSLASAGGLLFLSLVGAASRVPWALWRQSLHSDLGKTLRQSALSFAATLCLAFAALGIVLFGWALPLPSVVNWHALWAIVGWLGGLVGSVASAVVPMFHVTEAYPKPWLRALRALPLLLLIGSLSAWWGWEALASGVCIALAMLSAAFGVITGLRVRASKRGEHDAFYWGWQGLAAIAVLLAATALIAMFSPDPRWTLVFGVLALAGFGGCAVNVILYRIVPFLIWLHWQRHNKARVRLPLLHQILSPRWQQWQLSCDFLALLLLCLAAFFPAKTELAAGLFAVSKAVLGVHIALGVRGYRRELVRIKALPPRVKPA